MDQWFVKIDHNSFRKQAINEIDRVSWIPDWGVNRIKGAGAIPAGLVHQPPAYLGCTHPGILRRERRANSPTLKSSATPRA
jgi:hypothetical protein